MDVCQAVSAYVERMVKEAEAHAAEDKKRREEAETRNAAEQQPASRAGHQHSYIANDTKGDYLKRLRRIEGQARGLQRMVEEEKYCIDILTQVSALTRALQGVATGLLDDHLKHCVLDAAKLSDEAAVEKIQEATDAINRLVRS